MENTVYYSNYPVILYPEYFSCAYPLILDSHLCNICPGTLSYRTYVLFFQVPCHIDPYIIFQLPCHIAPMYYFPDNLSYRTHIYICRYPIAYPNRVSFPWYPVISHRVLIVSWYPVISPLCNNCLQVPCHIAPVYYLSQGSLSCRTCVLFLQVRCHIVKENTRNNPPHPITSLSHHHLYIIHLIKGLHCLFRLQCHLNNH